MRKQYFTGKLTSYERMNNSVNGNPRYYGTFESETGDILKATTKSDESCGYSFLNNQEKNRTLQYHETKTGSLIIDCITIQ